MATIVVHGTMTVKAPQHIPWWWDSWGEGGFLNAMAQGMDDALDGWGHDVWHVGGVHVSEVAKLNPERSWALGRIGQITQHHGHFFWNGADMYAAREGAAKALAHYLTALWDLLGDEPLRIVAHSHGCNVVKMASSRPDLPPDLWIHRAVFLACPHFVAQGHAGDHFPYRMDPDRFGEVLNLSSSEDTVQVGLADALPGPAGMRMNDFLPPEAHREDPDPEAAFVYRNYRVPTVDRGKKAHTSIHGRVIGYLAGGWLQTGNDFGAFMEYALEDGLLPVPLGDYGG